MNKILANFAAIFSISLLLAAPPAVRRVVAIGDIHGDLDSFVGILQRTHLVDANGNWSGGNTTLVQTGDFLDRGPKARGAMDLLMNLQREAKGSAEDEPGGGCPAKPGAERQPSRPWSAAP